MNFSYCDDTSNLTDFRFPFSVNIFFKINGFLIIILNLLVLACLIVYRRSFAGSYWYQLTCLSINDVMAGVGVLLMTLQEYDYVRRNIHACSFAFVASIMAQIATLLNITGICIHRFLTAKRISSPDVTSQKSRTPIVLMVTSWTISILYCSFPFIAWKQTSCEIYSCAFETIFDKNFNKAVGFLFNGLMIPLILTNVLYMFTYVRIKKSLNAINPTTTVSHVTNPSRFESDTSKAKKEKGNTIQPGSSCETNVNSNGSSTQGNGSTVISVFKDAVHFQAAESNTLSLPSSSIQRTGILSTQACCSRSEGAAPPNSNSQIRNAKTTNATKSRRRRSFFLIGLVLFVLNVLTWPSAIISALSMIPRLYVELTYGVKVGLLATITMNSLVNPFIYSLQVKEFRVIFRDVKAKITRLFTRR